MPRDEEADALNNPRFASDVYSFGMCIIEAFSDEPPYALVFFGRRVICTMGAGVILARK